MDARTSYENADPALSKRGHSHASKAPKNIPGGSSVYAPRSHILRPRFRTARDAPAPNETGSACFRPPPASRHLRRSLAEEHLSKTAAARGYLPRRSSSCFRRSSSVLGSPPLKFRYTVTPCVAESAE